jgi:hypothetical protein
MKRLFDQNLRRHAELIMTFGDDGEAACLEIY